MQRFATMANYVFRNEIKRPIVFDIFRQKILTLLVRNPPWVTIVGLHRHYQFSIPKIVHILRMNCLREMQFFLREELWYMTIDIYHESSPETFPEGSVAMITKLALKFYSREEMWPSNKKWEYLGRHDEPEKFEFYQLILI